jgi:hypothetical protein
MAELILARPTLTPTCSSSSRESTFTITVHHLPDASRVKRKIKIAGKIRKQSRSYF